METSELYITIDQRSTVPLYEQICQQIRQRIESKELESGTQLPTSQALSDTLQITYRTAHRAMATLAKEGYVTRAAKRGTVVKGIPRRGVVGIYAWLEMFGPGSKHEYYRLILRHLSRQLDGLHRVHRLYMGAGNSGSPNLAGEDLLQHMSAGVLCGVVAVNTFPRVEELMRLSRAKRIPVVCFERGAEAEYSVFADYLGFVRSAVRHLQEHGRSRIGVIFSKVSRSLPDAGLLMDIMSQCGCEIRPGAIIAEDESEKGGYDAVGRLPLSELDGLIVADDLMSLGVDRRLAELRIAVPQALMVATLWNRGSRLRLQLPFERFEFDVEKQAKLSLHMLQEAINGRRIAQPHLELAPGLGVAGHSLKHSYLSEVL